MLAKRGELRVATGQQLVRVALVRDVEGELVLRRLKNAVERDGQLDHAKVGADVTAMVGSDRDDLVSDLLRQLRQDSCGQSFQIFRAADAIDEQQSAGQSALAGVRIDLPMGAGEIPMSEGMSNEMSEEEKRARRG